MKFQLKRTIHWLKMYSTKVTVSFTFYFMQVLCKVLHCIKWPVLMIRQNFSTSAYFYGYTKKRKFLSSRLSCINLFLSNVVLLYSPKTSETLWLSDVFRGYRNATLGRNGLIRHSKGLFFRSINV